MVRLMFVSMVGAAAVTAAEPARPAAGLVPTIPDGG